MMATARHGPTILGGLLVLVLILQSVCPARGRPPPGDAGTSWQSLPVRIDMGLAPKTDGAFFCDSEFRGGMFAWIRGMVRNGLRPSERNPWLCTFGEGYDATFAVGVKPTVGTYTVRVTLGDPELPRGPVRVTAGTRVVAPAVSTTAGQSRVVEFPMTPRNGRLEINFRASGCRGFAVAGIELSGPKGAAISALDPGTTPTPAAVAPGTPPRLDAAARRLLLRRICDHLIQAGPSEGCFSYHGAWYENAYPIRCLLAGSRLLNMPAYAEAAYACLDRFVARQGADRNWLAAYTGPSSCDGVGEPDSSSANLADVGLMTLCVSAVAAEAGPARLRRYETAARLYADNISLPNQLPDGSFPNRKWAGKDFRHPYSVATATQCASLSALYLLTREARYRTAAESAARWLTTHSFRDDGRLTFYPHDRVGPVVLESTQFGDAFYVAEALIWARRATSDATLRRQIDATLDRWLFGTDGLKAKSVQGAFWPRTDAWGDSKMVGMIYLLSRHTSGPHAAEVASWVDRMEAWMSDPERSRTVGVLAEQGSTRGLYTLAASGVAGLGIAVTMDSAATR